MVACFSQHGQYDAFQKRLGIGKVSLLIDQADLNSVFLASLMRRAQCAASPGPWRSSQGRQRVRLQSRDRGSPVRTRVKIKFRSIPRSAGWWRSRCRRLQRLSNSCRGQFAIAAKERRRAAIDRTAPSRWAWGRHSDCRACPGVPTFPHRHAASTCPDKAINNAPRASHLDDLEGPGARHGFCTRAFVWNCCMAPARCKVRTARDPWAHFAGWRTCALSFLLPVLACHGCDRCPRKRRQRQSRDH